MASSSSIAHAAPPGALIPATRDSGGKQVELALEGMTCAACAARIEKSLNRLPGVDAAVNFVTESAHVAFDASRTAVDDLLRAVSRAGYAAHVMRDRAAERAEDEARRRAVYRALRTEFIIACVLSLPLVIQMVPMFAGGWSPASAHGEWLPRWLQLALTTPIQLWIGRRFYIGAWHSLRGGGANMDVLIALGTTMAYVWSTAVTLAGLHEHVYFEASAVVITLVLLGKLLEARARVGTSAALESLLKLAPKIAHLERDGRMIDVPLEKVAVGDRFVVRAGESFPVDGEVVSGGASVDESMLTGESRLVAKAPGARVFAGTLNQDGMLTAKATGVGEATLLAGIVRVVAAAQGSKAPIQRLADRVSGVFVPIVIALAVVTFFATWWLAGDVTRALSNAVAVLVIACPCALGLATPTAIIVGTGRGAQSGVLIRNAAALEQAGRMQAVVIDKTGTLTEGHPAVVEIRTLGAASQNDVLAVAASLEHGTTHPLARAILEKASADAVPVREIADFTAVPGAGGRGRFVGDSALLRVGSVAFLAEAGVAMGAIDRGEWAEQGMTIVGVARDRECIGLIALQDRIRSTSASAVHRLRAMGIEVRMLTGDNAATAAAVANQVGITEFRSGVLPAGKAEAVQALRAQGRVTGMVGDGINDAPALAAADVSFAIGTGSDIAIEAADITAMRADLNAVVDAVLLSRATLAKIRQNLFFAFAYNVIGIPLAAFGWLSPVIAGAAMAASSVSVVGNALLLRRWRPKDGID